MSIYDDEVTNRISLPRLFMKLWPFMARYRWLLWGTVLAIVTFALVGRLLPNIVGRAIDDGFLQNSYRTVLVLAGIYFALEVLKAFLLFAHRYLFFKLGNRVLHDLRHQLIVHLQSLPMSYFDRNPSGRIVTRMTNDVESLGELFTQGLIEVFAQLLSLIFILIAMLLISPKLTAVAMISMPLMVGAGLFLSHLIRLAMRETKRHLARINAFVAENINGMKIIQAYSQVPKQIARFESRSEDYKLAQWRTVKLFALLWPSVAFFNAAAIIAALLYGGYLNRTEGLALGLLVAFILHVQDFVHPMRIILERFQQFQNSLTGAERIFTLLDEKPEAPPALPERPKELKGHIVFDRVGFTYPGYSEPVLKDLSFEVQPGQSIALVGRTGSGKTSIISLLQRLYDYNEGEIYFDGTPLKSIPRRFVRARIGVVLQDNFLFRGTLGENISLNNPAISTERIQEALERAHATRLMDRRGGLGAKVEEKGSNFSHGERQLLAFARVLAYDPEILILDEATANIDSESEAAIQFATKEVTKDRTSLIIAHRLSTILHCDKILVLKDGELKEQGSHTELLARGGIYADLYRAQGLAGQTLVGSPSTSTTSG